MKYFQFCGKMKMMTIPFEYFICTITELFNITSLITYFPISLFTTIHKLDVTDSYVFDHAENIHDENCRKNETEMPNFLITT